MKGFTFLCDQPAGCESAFLRPSFYPPEKFMTLNPIAAQALALHLPAAMKAPIARFNDDDLYVYRTASNELIEQISSGSPRCRAVKYGQERLADGLAWVPGMTARRMSFWSRASAEAVDLPEPVAPALEFSDEAKKKVSLYLRRMTDDRLSGYRNSWTRMQLNEAATDALEQIMRENPAPTGYGAAMDGIKRELTT